MRAVILAITLILSGCGPSEEPVEPVNLITGPPKDYPGCFLFSVSGFLVADPTYGTAIVPDSANAPTGPVPVAWRRGVTARRQGSLVAIYAPNGTLLAVTGSKYLLPGGYVSAGGSSGLIWPELNTHVFWVCDKPEPV